MRPNTLPVLAFLGLAATAAYADSGDASDQFLNAFLAFQKGEKAEASGNVRGALGAYNQTINYLDQIHDFNFIRVAKLILSAGSPRVYSVERERESCLPLKRTGSAR